jgi:putative flavoprotein involved in K+ transport
MPGLIGGMGSPPEAPLSPNAPCCLRTLETEDDMERTMLVEEGQALQGIALGQARRAPEPLDVVVVGGGQAGLSVGYHLQRRGLRFVILEADARIGDAWRKRWDSLRLFTPAAYDGLDGMPFPAPADAFPTKDEMGDYLEQYAGRFALPVRTGTRVERARRDGERYLVEAGERRFVARHVVVAMGTYQKPKVPAFASELDGRIVQLHSGAYRGPSQLGPGDVLLVGAGNSGAEIAKDVVAPGRRVYVAGREVG